jgi:hypothetical protein
MKKITILLAIIPLSLNFLYAQTTLQYAVHALKAGKDNPMSYCSYSDPGMGGNDQTWNFSKLQFEKPFIGYVKEPDYTDYKSAFPKSNTVLTEFNTLFYLNVTKDQVAQYGYISSDGNTKITYSVPFIKMKFPFGYGDIYSGSIIGTTEEQGKLTGNITGNYTVEADGYGALILPNNTIFEDVLRVKTIKTYDNQLSNLNQHVSIVTYRWYNAVHRYPLLVLIEIKSSSGGDESINYQAAYNSDAIPNLKATGLELSEDNLVLFPNPVTSSLTMTFSSPVSGNMNVEFYHADGKLILSFNQDYHQGTFNYDLTKYVSGFNPGQYILVANFGGSRIVKDFTLVR